MPELPPGAPADLVIVGAGPKTTGVLLALAATEHAGEGLRIHLIDPFPPGAGRIWRTAQSPHLWMNSRTEDVTIFPDASSSLDRTPVPGPSLDAWVHGEDREILAAAGLGEEALSLGPQSFPSRRIQGHYLEWAFARALDRLAATVHLHRARAESVHRLPHGGWRVLTSEGAMISARVLVSAQGHLDMALAEADAEFAEPQGSRGLHYQAPGFTADLDFGAIPGGVDVLTRGFGLAFVDLMIMLTQGRGGEFFDCGGRLRYRASGREPVLWVGSSRGVAYSPKLGYSRTDLPGAPAVDLRYLTRLTEDESQGAATIDFATIIGPLSELELTYAHYAHVQWRRGIDASTLLAVVDEGAELILTGTADLDSVRTAIAEAAAGIGLAPVDRFDLAALDRPLDDVRAERLGDAEDRVRTHLERELDRAADLDRSADLAVFEALIKAYVVIRGLVRERRVSPRDRTEFVEGRFHSLFSFIGSGPPPIRVEQMLALNEAGLLRFFGPGLSVSADERGFHATSSAHPEGRDFTYFVDARLARQSAARALDPALTSLREAGAIRLEDDGGAGKLLTDERSRALDADGHPQPDLFLLGPAVSGSAGEAFSRPGTGAPVFADNERVASAILDAIDASPVARWGRSDGDPRSSLLAG